MTVTINRTVRPPVQTVFQGKGFVGLFADKATTFAGMSQYSTLLMDGIHGSVDESHHGQQFQVFSIMIGGALRGCIVKVNGYRIGVYAFTSAEDGKENCLKMLEDCQGNNSEYFAKLSPYFQKRKAQDLYNWEGSYFGNGYLVLQETLATVNLSMEHTKEMVERKTHGLSEMLNFAEICNLLRDMSAEYGIYNLDVESIKFDGKRLADARSDAQGYNEIGRGHVLRFSELSFRHTIIHEFAHAVNFARDGSTGHGNRFREVYEELLRKFGGAAHVNVNIPRV